MNFRKILFAATATAMSVALAGPAQAINFTVTNGTTGPLGETNLGGFSEESDVTTIDFNDGLLPTTVGLATFTATGDVNISADGFAPRLCNIDPAPCNETSPESFANDSNYLAIFEPGSVQIDFAEELDYFGFNFGFADIDNLIAVFSLDGEEIGSFREDDLFGSVDSEDSGYINFFADGTNFDQVVFTQTGGGGFEIDNIAYKQAVPEPTSILSFLALSSLAVAKKLSSSKSS